MLRGLRLIVAAALLAWVTAPVLAHHSFAAEYDINKPVSLTGAVTKLEWQNPHVRFYIDVKDDAGTVTNWELTMGGPNGLLRRGWTRNLIKIGDTVTVSGYLARDGSHLANARTIRLSNGKELFGGTGPGSEAY